MTLIFKVMYFMFNIFGGIHCHVDAQRIVQTVRNCLDENRFVYIRQYHGEDVDFVQHFNDGLPYYLNFGLR